MKSILVNVNNLKDQYHVDNSSSYWNAFWFWSYNVRNEQVISITEHLAHSVMSGFFCVLHIWDKLRLNIVLLLLISCIIKCNNTFKILLLLWEWEWLNGFLWIDIKPPILNKGGVWAQIINIVINTRNILLKYWI